MKEEEKVEGKKKGSDLFVPLGKKAEDERKWDFKSSYQKIYIVKE